MQGLLARISSNQQKTPNLGSRSGSVASSTDDREEQNEAESDESQSQQSSNTLKPKVKKDKKADLAKEAKAKEVKPKVASRINSNMVKLKLLDATRKAIIDKTKRTFENASSQTDTFKTKLCKDQSVENQNDLVSQCDESTETDIEFVAIRAKDGTLIVTSTCAVNTDNISVESVSTQTAMPRSNVSFKRLKDAKHSIQYVDDEEFSGEESDGRSKELMVIEKRLRSRKKLPRQKSQSQNDDEPEELIPTVVDNKTSIKKNGDDDSESDLEDSIDEDDFVKKDTKSYSNRSDNTLNSWHDMKQPKVELPRNYFVDGPTPWANFQDLALGQRFLNARLPQRDPRANSKQVVWSDTQLKIISDLTREANSLLEMFDQVAMLLGPDVKLHNVSDVEEFKLPPPKFSEEMVKSCDKLEASLKRLNDVTGFKS